MMQALYTRQTAVSHADMTSQVQPGNPAGPLPLGHPSGSMLDALNGEITRQASMVGLIDVFKLMLLLTIAVAPLLLIMRKPKAAAASPAEIAVD
jgi:DHA2 family multidrug resistance protein